MDGQVKVLMDGREINGSPPIAAQLHTVYGKN